MRSFMWSLSSFKRRLGLKKTSKRRKRKLVILTDDTTSKGMLSTVENQLLTMKKQNRLCKRVVKGSQHDDPGPSRGQPSDDEDGGQTSVEASDHSDADLSAGKKTDDDESSVKAHKDKAEKPSFFCNRRLRQAVKNKCTANKRKRAEKTWNDGLESLKQRKRSKLNEWLGIRTRSSPTQLTRCIKILSDEQRLAVKEMGFGRLLNLKMDGISAKLRHYVVDNFDPGSLELTLPSATLSIDAKVVHKILGIPIVGVSFNALESRDAHDEGISKWKKSYPPSKFISPKQMVDMIEKESN
ncbi:hypothetical protein M8C21_012587, partial [Ambrosia artemisiifolia]